MSDERALPFSMLANESSRAPLDPVLRSFLNPLPQSRRPTPDSNRLEVALVWGADQLLDVKEVLADEPFTIGAQGDASMQVFHAATDRGPIPILELAPHGVVATIPVEARGRVCVAGVERSPLELVGEGGARPVEAPFVGIRVELGLDDRLELEFGRVRLIARFARPARAPARSPFGWPFRFRVAGYVVGAFIVHHALVSMLALSSP